MAARYSHCTVWHSSNMVGFVTIVALTLSLLNGTAGTAFAQGKAGPKKTPLVPERNWQILFSGQSTKRKTVIPLDKFPVLANDTLEFVGPRPGDRYQLGKFRTDGQWGIQQGLIKRTAGENAALVLAEAEDFELEGRINAEGVGGWFWLLGWKDGNGYGLYNITFKQSGSPWFATEFEDHDALNSGEELRPYRWKGEQPFWMSVENKKLNLKIGNRTAVIRDMPLPNYQRGQIILGTYDTRYGPKDIQIRSLRIRLPPKKK
ncbi:hypothetical protein [Symmachiella dynata]|uniref:hypothetical protein n=1 Tax=Symmachiella dynata TaxID=2527995 RepID=UPI0011AA40A0|nr:hypothetical protein [Symmachiella dynata]